MFNIVLETGIVSNDWSIGVIKPIYKNKGSYNDPDNYRGITILSCMGKLFTSLLNNSLTKYLNDYKIIGEEQAGFRKGYSTSDHIFTLKCLIDLYLFKKKRLYCAFIDYRKAFDTVNRCSLWSKLLSNNINGKVLNVIKNIYMNAKTCVKSNNELSSIFSCKVGVRHGDNLSPLLFALYLNDLEMYMSKFYKGLPIWYPRWLRIY